MNRLSITTRALALTGALLMSALLPPPAIGPQQHAGIADVATELTPIAAKLTLQAAHWTLSTTLDALSAAPAAERNAAVRRPTKIRRPLLMPFYSFASASSRTRES